MTYEALRNRAADIGDEAFDLELPEEQKAYIDEQCGGNTQLKEMVLAYMQRAEQNIPALDSLLQSVEKPLDHRLGRKVGYWLLQQVLGDGGFGVVYLADRQDGQVRQRAALKFLKGTINSRDIEIRFLDERQILANLQHRYIVRLIDAGSTDEGQPYLAMEYLRNARPIDVYCRENNLSLRQRIELFVKVCEAVAYAHGQAVIHRDLKPGNVLISEDGTPRLLDFGLAKILDPIHRGAADSALHSRSVRMGSGRYMSPEQTRSESTSVRTDIYSLGIMLYELLTGTDPYDLVNHAQEPLEQVICRLDPEKASVAVARAQRLTPPGLLLSGSDLRRWQSTLNSDLETILQMALRKDPARRYESVLGLLGDLPSVPT